MEKNQRIKLKGSLVYGNIDSCFGNSYLVRLDGGNCQLFNESDITETYVFKLLRARTRLNQFIEAIIPEDKAEKIVKTVVCVYIGFIISIISIIC